jgi:hypothetical protein
LGEGGRRQRPPFPKPQPFAVKIAPPLHHPGNSQDKRRKSLRKPIGSAVRKTAVGILVVAACGLAAACFPLRALTLRAGDAIIFCRLVKPGDTFLLKYLHSVALSDVWERFAIDRDYHLTLTETRFKGQGAGLPAGLDGNEKLTRQGEWFIISGMTRTLPSLFWRIQPQWEDRFRFGDEPEHNISRRVGAALVLIQGERITLGAYLGYRLIGNDVLTTHADGGI